MQTNPAVSRSEMSRGLPLSEINESANEDLQSYGRELSLSGPKGSITSQKLMRSTDEQRRTQ